MVQITYFKFFFVFKDRSNCSIFDWEVLGREGEEQDMGEGCLTT